MKPGNCLIKALGAVVFVASCGGGAAKLPVVLDASTELPEFDLVDELGGGPDFEAGVEPAETFEALGFETVETQELTEPEVMEGDFGWPCDDNTDCLSGFCVETGEGSQCTMNCVDECPENWTCEQNLAALPDVIYICVPGNTSFLLMGERSLAHLAAIAGDKAMADRRQKRLDRGIAAMHEHMWDQSAGTFLAVRRDSLVKIPVATIGSWMSLLAGVPTEDMAARMAETLATDDWMTPLPVATVGRNDPRWNSKDFWRGDAWAPTNYQVAAGLAQYGHRELAAKIADATVANALEVGINERYDSVTGAPLGVFGLGMSCTILTMILDGLSREYSAEVLPCASGRAGDGEIRVKDPGGNGVAAPSLLP